MAQLQMLYCEWLHQDLVDWIQINLLPQSLAWLLGCLVLAPTIAYCSFLNIGTIILRPDKYNIRLRSQMKN